MNFMKNIIYFILGKACDEGKLIMGNDDFPAKDYMNKIVESKNNFFNNLL